MGLYSIIVKFVVTNCMLQEEKTEEKTEEKEKKKKKKTVKVIDLPIELWVPQMSKEQVNLLVEKEVTTGLICFGCLSPTGQSGGGYSRFTV